MKRPSVLFVVLLFSAALLAGCLGGDDDSQINNDDDDDANAQDTGVVRGRVLTVELKEVVNARVSIVADSDVVEEARSSENGNYEIRGVEPGSYRLRVATACCKEDVQAIQVEAGNTLEVDVQLEPYTDDDLKVPFVDELEWDGFISCGVGSPVLVISVCSLEELDDPNDDFLHRFDLNEGLKSVTVGMVWEASGGVLGQEMQIFMERDGCGLGCESGETYGGESGTSPLEFRVDSPGGDLSFEEIDVNRTVQYRVFPSFDANVFYQQPFTVYYHMHYHKAAPEGYDPIPDL